MREDDAGRDTVPLWRVSQLIFAADGERGTVVSVDDIAGTVTVQWTSYDFPVVYPNDVKGLRRAYPWES